MSRRGWLLFLLMSVIWGIPYLLIRVAIRDLSPPTLVFARTFPAALLLLPLALCRGQVAALLARWRWIALFALVEMAIPWLLLSRAEQHLSSSLSGLLIASVPFISALVYRLSPTTDRLNRRRLLGLAIGFAGVAILVGIDLSSSNLLALSEVGIVALGYSLGPLIVSKKLSDLPSLGVVSVALTLTAVVYAPFALTRIPHHLSVEVGTSVLGLAFICTALAFLVFFQLIAEVGPARALVITYVNPAIAVLLGVAVLSESFTVGIAIGFPLILAGSILATGKEIEVLAPPQLSG
ncbi:MAG TPA: DMT family transporter [Acidimicrobiales bacterium]|nr:DMT family transporter [Acidimicrobiales bacterium]